jgi:hypothetical protein
MRQSLEAAGNRGNFQGNAGQAFRQPTVSTARSFVSSNRKELLY